MVEKLFIYYKFTRLLKKYISPHANRIVYQVSPLLISKRVALARLRNMQLSLFLFSVHIPELPKHDWCWFSRDRLVVAIRFTTERREQTTKERRGEKKRQKLKYHRHQRCCLHVVSIESAFPVLIHDSVFKALACTNIVKRIFDLHFVEIIKNNKSWWKIIRFVDKEMEIYNLPQKIMILLAF